MSHIPRTVLVLLKNQKSKVSVIIRPVYVVSESHSERVIGGGSIIDLKMEHSRGPITILSKGQVKGHRPG